MQSDAVQTPSRTIYFHDRLLTLVACCLCVTAQLKFLEIQYLELIYAVDMVLVLSWMAFQPPPYRVFRPLFRIGRAWFLFSFIALLLAIYSLRQDFFIASTSPLKQPFIVSLARVGELTLDVFAMLYLAERFRRDLSLCRFGCFAFYLVGMASCAYGLISELALPFGLGLAGASSAHRMTGFNNEPGPYGAYLVAVIFLVAAIRSQRWITRRHYLLSTAVLLLCLILSSSASAMLEIFVCFILIAVMRLSFSKAIATGLATVIIGFTLFQSLGLKERSLGYLQAASQYPRLSKLRPKDGNVTLGRVSGLFFAPQMFARHPLAGIGWGNYPLLRDDPQYRQGSPIVGVSLDSPSLGFVDYIVDLGIPLCLFLTWVELAPAVAILRRGASGATVALILILPVSTWFGAHLNFTYMWIVAAMGLGISYASPRPSDSISTASNRHADAVLSSI